MEEWSDGEDESGSPGTADHYEMLVSILMSIFIVVCIV